MQRTSSRALLSAPALLLAALSALFTFPCSAPAESKPEPMTKTMERTYTNSIDMEFVLIPAGTFQMGCTSWSWAEACYPWEKPRHQVTISRPFYSKRDNILRS